MSTSRTIRVIGAGLSGLIAGAMLRNRLDCIEEMQPSLPNNHRALLRFRSRAVADAVNIPFKQVMAIRAVQRNVNPVADAISYAFKATGSYATDRSLIGLTPEPVRRYIAPEDLVAQLASLIPDDKLKFGCPYVHKIGDQQPIISTIPLPDMLKALNIPFAREFAFRPIVILSAPVRSGNGYATVYDPRPECPILRSSITGDRLIVESNFEDWKSRNSDDDNDYEQIEEFLRLGAIRLGIKSEDIGEGSVSFNMKAKILPIPEQERIKLLVHLTKEHNIYSLGRYATWRPGLLLDDVVKDVQQITAMIDGHSRLPYERNLP